MNRVVGIVMTTGVVMLLIFITTFFAIRARGDGSDSDSADESVENTSPTSSPSPPTPTASPAIPDVNQPPVDTHGDEGCGGEQDTCSFVDDFSHINDSRWDVADNYSNGEPFANWWSRSAISSDLIDPDVDPGGGVAVLNVSVMDNPKNDLQFASGQMRSRSWFTYGCFEARIRPVKQSGLVGAFFLYTGEHDAAPGQPDVHNEIDIEFVYRMSVDYLAVQSNFFVDGGRNEQLHFPPQAPQEAQDAFHNYGFRWTSRGVDWFIDGVLIRSANSSQTPTLERAGPLRLFVNLWPVSSDSVDGQEWAGVYRYDETARSMLFDWIRFVRGENCTLSDDDDDDDDDDESVAMPSPVQSSAVSPSSSPLASAVAADAVRVRPGREKQQKDDWRRRRLSRKRHSRMRQPRLRRLGRRP